MTVFNDKERTTVMDTPNFKLERKAANLSLAQLATLTGFSRSHIANVEAGIVGASQRYIESFNRALGLGTTDLANQVPITKLVQDLAIKAVEANDLNDSVQEAAVKLKQLAKITNDMVLQMNTIAKAQIQTHAQTKDTQTQTSMDDPIDKIVQIIMLEWIKDHPNDINEKADSFNKIVEQAWIRLTKIQLPDPTNIFAPRRRDVLP